MTFVSYAQNFEDVMLWRALGTVQHGFYIDVGAHHPDADSVTRAFYDRGWTGINIEPVPTHANRIRAARWRDTTLAVALGAAPGRATLRVVGQSGLSTLSPDIATRHQDEGWPLDQVDVPVQTLAELCLTHAPGPIHFLKIDVEGAERDVLLGADFTRWRPWIVLVESTAPNQRTETHADWEDLLLIAGYTFVWFDGLNRFYLADERHAELEPHFRLPPNIWDGFVRAADTATAPSLAAAELDALRQLQRVSRAETREAGALREAAAARALSDARGQDLARLHEVLGETHRAHAAAHADWSRQTEALNRYFHDVHRVLDAERALAETARTAAQHTRDMLDALYGSTSWRLTSPLRRTMERVRPRPALLPPPVPPAPDRTLPPPPAMEAVPPRIRPLPPIPAPPPRTGVRTVHQYHSGAAAGDAVTNAMLLIRGILRGWGYRSDIFVTYRNDAPPDQVRLLEELPRHGNQILLVHHSMGFSSFDHILGLPGAKVLVYHNVTPPEFLDGNAFLQEHAVLGRRQLARLRTAVAASLAVSEFNLLELRRLGFDGPEASTLLFDVDALRDRAARTAGSRTASSSTAAPPFTVLFVGRICASKGQADLVAAFARFAALFAGPAHLVLVGRDDGPEDPYLRTIRAAVGAAGLQDRVTLTGLVDDEELHRRYASADLYVSLSRHEGFGVPLVEAMAHGLPVLAWPAGAIPFTLGGLSLASRDPEAVAAAMHALAIDPAARDALAARQAAQLDRFRLADQVPALGRALARAGAAPPALPHTRDTLDRTMRFTVTGHTAGSYSLAAVNRTLALALDAARPGTRLVPAEAAPRLEPHLADPRLADLAARDPEGSAPEVVISQHYPVLVPDRRGDLLLALFFWEESVVPLPTVRVLNASFDGVLAPSAFVAKALIDSGVTVPVATVGFAPSLSAFVTQGHAARALPRAPGTFTFLHVSSCFPRKGVDLLLAAYAAAFRATDPVRLVVKGFPNPHNDVADQVARLRLRDPAAPAIEVIDADLDGPALLDLYASAHAMVLPTRGEGLNIPAAEAMAAGLPLIVTGHGGHMDFCDPATARLLPFRFAPSGSHLGSAGSVWTEPDVDALAASLRDAVENPHDAAVRARTAKRRAETLADPAPFARRVADATLDMLLAPLMTPVRLAWVSTWGVRCGVAEYSRHLLDATLAAHPGAIGDVAILCDGRTAPDTSGSRPAVVPGWDLGWTGSLDRVTDAVSAVDPDLVVIQHQPGLLRWRELGLLLRHPALAGRPAVVTLHSTRHLHEVNEEERRFAVNELSRAARVVVHTVADLNLLLALGLSANVTLVPHGSVPRATAPATDRTLTPADAPVIGCYGFFLPGKGIPDLVHAVAILRQDWPGARLRLVNADYGSPDSAAEIISCRTLANELDVPVDWHTDFLPDAESTALLAGCDVIALPYQASLEASSAALRTALRAGPAVAVTPLPLFDEAADAVFRFGGTDPASVAVGLRGLLADADLRGTLRHAGADWLAGRDWAAVGERFGGMLRALVRAAA